MHPRPTPKPSALSVLNLKCLAISLEGHLYAPILSDRRWARRPAGGRWRAEHNCGGLKRLGVADGDAENAAIGGLEDRGDAVAVPADRRLNLASVAGEPRDLFKAAHDIDMRQGLPAVLAAPNRGDMTAVEADQKDRGRYSVAARTQRDLRLA